MWCLLLSGLVYRDFLCGRRKATWNQANATDQHICDPFDAYDIVEHWKTIAQVFIEKWTYDGPARSNQKQWGQSPSIENTRAYRWYDLDLHTKISIWEIIRFEPGWVPKHEINARLISAVIFFLPICDFALDAEIVAIGEFARARAHARAKPDAFAIRLMWRHCWKLENNCAILSTLWSQQMRSSCAVIRNNGVNLRR